MNPVFDTDDFQPHRLSREIFTVGLRDAEDIQSMMGFSQFAGGLVNLSNLEPHLAVRV